jgi:RNA polymerase sigma-70 factor, ECF subfamily
MDPHDLSTFRSAHARAITERFAAGDAARWALSLDTFADALFRSAVHRFPSDAPDTEVAAYLETLHVDDLALACACREGNPEAWDYLVIEFRPALYAAARSVAGEDHRDLADSLYAELYGVSARGDARTSLLAWYHGRSRLVTWLRSVLVQRHIDARRTAARSGPWDPDAETERGTTHTSETRQPAPGRADTLRAAQDALDRAIETLDPRDRLRLRLYYGEDLTLAQVGRVLSEHEATVSRKLERSRRQLRRLVEQHLKAEHGMTNAAIEECYALAADAPELHLTRLLSPTGDG